MRKNFTLLFLFISLIAKSATPVLDGIVTPADGYTLIGTGDGIAGWSGANAKKIYAAVDANYYYLAAEVTASGWMSWAFVVNATTGGAAGDSWSRKVVYNHTDKPDLTFRGNFGAAPVYAEYHVWNGTAWDGLGTNVNIIGTEVMTSVVTTDQDGFVELRIPKAGLGTVTTLDLQFYITGDQDDHGSFDAIPNDNNATDWVPPGSITTLSNYVTVDLGTLMPLNLLSFSANMQKNSLLINWKTANEINVSHFEIELSADATTWRRAATVASKNTVAGYAYAETIETTAVKKHFVRLKMVDKDGRYSYSQNLLIRLDNNVKMELWSNPVKGVINIASGYIEGKVQAELISLDGKKVKTTQFNTNGGATTLQMNISNVQAGIYILNINGQDLKQQFKVVVQ